MKTSKSHLVKKINGKSFEFKSREFNKSFAQKVAKELRKAGNCVRIITESNGNALIYTCSK